MKKRAHKKKFEDSLDMYQFGLYMGYPECCVEEFIERMRTWTDEQWGAESPRKLRGTGYVPCLGCNKLSEEALLDNIKKNRLCSEPFPNFDFDNFKKENPKP